MTPENLAISADQSMVRKPYTSPQLVELGSAQDITAQDDGFVYDGTLGPALGGS